MSRCLYCGGDLSENALFCPRCMVPIARRQRRRPDTLGLVLGVFLLTSIPCVWVISGEMQRKAVRAPISPITVHAASVPAPDEAGNLIRRCGPPSSDQSTANNDPRPPIPFRVLDYKSQHLQFAFVPGGGARMGDPPPYRWALSGILDSTTNQRITTAEAAKRMSCVAPSGASVGSSVDPADNPAAMSAVGATPATPIH